MSNIDHARLEQVCQAFCDGPGKRAVIVQDKNDPAAGAAFGETALFPSASLIKIAIACAAVDAPDIDLSNSIRVSALDETFYCSILKAFDPGDEISLKTLIGLMLIVSDNPATTSILNTVGHPAVMHWLNKNGLSQSTFSIGFEDTHLGAPLRANVTTAEDCLRLLEIVDQTADYAFIKTMLANNLRNERIPKRLPDHVVIAHKTGTLHGLMHDIAIVESAEAAYYLVILLNELPEDTDYGAEIAAFSHHVYTIMSS